jgi:hypothetical protein
MHSEGDLATQNNNTNTNNNDNDDKTINNNDNNNDTTTNGVNENIEDRLNLTNGLHVMKATSWHQDLEEDYKMSSPSRGHCLIVNNVVFDLDMFPKRKGSDKDAFRFKDIFTQLGFEVDCKRNLNSEKMKSIFKQKAALCHSKHDALVVILLSHGTESGIYGIDGIEIDLNDILSYFDNKKCKAMRGKPKIFIVQACRGRQADYGVRETQTFFSQPESQTFAMPSQLTQVNSQPTKIPRWIEIDRDHHPTRTDMVLCFASHSGYVSTRNEEDGSWLGDSLAYHLVREAHRRHLLEIFNMVSRDVRKRRSNDGIKQVLEVTTIGFDKNLYFNPGLSDAE